MRIVVWITVRVSRTLDLEKELTVANGRIADLVARVLPPVTDQVRL